MTVLSAEFTPVIVGIGEVQDRAVDAADGREPIVLMAAAARAAADDACSSLLDKIDSLWIVNQATWRYADPVGQLAQALGIGPVQGLYGPVGGESPVRFLAEAAARIRRGESAVALICGAEAQYTLNKARALKIDLPWTKLAPRPIGPGPVDFLNPVAHRHAMLQPAHVYPLYESATQAAWGQSFNAAKAETGMIWAGMSRVAACNPAAWSAHCFAADDITEIAPANRMIAWPYTKRMVANPAVNMGGAIMLTSEARARASGIAEDRLVYVWSDAAASEPRDYLLRDQYARSHMQDTVLEALHSRYGAFDHVELYSCFPVIPKMARRTLGRSPDLPATVTGGLSFFGAPLNNYMTHAAAAMTRALRGSGQIGLLYGQGEFVTKHHGIVLAAYPPEEKLADAEHTVQARAQARYGEVPPLVESHEGSAKIEASTVLFDREGEVLHGTVIARTLDGARLMARVPRQATDSIARLLSTDRSPVGQSGSVRPGTDGMLFWYV